MSETLGDRIKAARRRAGLTQAQLAVQSGVDQMTVSRYERGLIKDPGGGKVAAMAKALGVTERWLLTGDTGPAAAVAEPEPPFWREFLARYEHLEQLSPEDIEGIKRFAARHTKVRSWTDLERIAEIVRRDLPSPTFERDG